MQSILPSSRGVWLVVALAACVAVHAFARDVEGTSPPPSAGAASAAADALAAVGKLAFFDPGLSASGKLACSTCHDPRHAFAPANALPVQLGGKDGRRQGARSTPSLLYLQQTIPFVERRFDDDDGGDADDATPAGGLTWDGRVDTLHDQARIPLFNANEMANASAADLRDRVRGRAWAAEFRAVASTPGHDVFDDPDAVVGALTLALEAYQQRSPEFQPFSSKYDAWLRGQAKLSGQELRGLALFDDPEKGNCASCHPDSPSPRGVLPAFTDFGHVAIGVPRNQQLEANRDPAHFDLGLCGPDRQDLVRHSDFCGAFITPTLRNVATRRSFFHNGAFHSLRAVLEFYVERDTKPARWYPVDRDGSVRKYDDLPPAYRANVNAEVPFKPAGSTRPRMNAREIDDMVAFLKTLTDGYTVPRNRAAPDQATALSTSAFQPAP
jgi:cytochrome c peroxidase